MGPELDYSAAQTERIRARFRTLVHTPVVEEATRELLLFAFFLATRKRATAAAAVLTAIAETASPVLAASGTSINALFESKSAHDRMRALGLTQPPSATEPASGGVSLLELLAKR